MPYFETRDGCRLFYHIEGEGPLVALTPGGREAGSILASTARALTCRARVLSWDRRNTGASDIYIGGPSEHEVAADDLADLLAHLGEGPAWLAGGSVGARIAIVAAARRPEIAKGLVLWCVPGADYGCQFLGFSYHAPHIMAAEHGGMAEVAQNPPFRDRIADNPRNRERLLSVAPADFIATLKRWNRSFYASPDCTVIGLPDALLRSVSVPTLIFEGGDDIHPAEVSRRVAALIPGAEIAPSPWPIADWMDGFTGRSGLSVFELYPLLAPPMLDFMTRHAAA
jgi:pimeloyl-ACP methyl ester carboxylesterase